MRGVPSWSQTGVYHVQGSKSRVLSLVVARRIDASENRQKTLLFRDGKSVFFVLPLVPAPLGPINARRDAKDGTNGAHDKEHYIAREFLATVTI